jgi:hypothetical protein
LKPPRIARRHKNASYQVKMMTSVESSDYSKPYRRGWLARRFTQVAGVKIFLPVAAS